MCILGYLLLMSVDPQTLESVLLNLNCNTLITLTALFNMAEYIEGLAKCIVIVGGL